jgi:hypothetical protein
MSPMITRHRVSILVTRFKNEAWLLPEIHILSNDIVDNFAALGTRELHPPVTPHYSHLRTRSPWIPRAAVPRH